MFNSKDVALADSVSVTGLSINNSNYNLVTSEFEISGVIMPKDIDIEQENAFTKVYDGTPIAVITEEHYRFVGVVSGDSVNLVFSSNSLNGVTKDNTTLLNITEMQIDNTNYNLTRTMLSISASITPKELQINVDIDQSKVYGSDDPIFSYNTDGLVEGDLFEGSLEREQGEDVGLYSINRGTLNPARASSYYITFNGEQFEITPKEITVSVDNNQSKIYGEADPESFTYQHTPLCFDDAFEGELSRVAGEAVGSYQIEQNTLSLNENYTIVYEQDSFVVNKKEIVISAISKQKTYGQIDPELEYSPIELVGDDTISGSLEREQGEDAASYDILIGSLQINDNYNINYVKAVFIINPKDIFVSVDSNQSKIYGEDDPILKYSSGELVGDDSFVGGLEREQGEDTGIYQINQGSLALPGGNYVINFNGGNFEITKRPIEINPNPAQKIYGDSDPEELLFELSEVVIESNELTGKLQRESGEDVGFYPITMGTISLGNNYEIIINYVEFEILPRPIEITAQNSIKTYGDMDGEFEYVISQGVLQGQDELTGSLSRDLGEDAGVYNITQGSLNNTNYDITFIGANLSIEQRAITVIADYIVKEYGATDPQLTYRVIDYTLPYGVSLNGELVRDEGEDAGIYTISQGTLNDENNPNYIINYIENNFKINQKKIYVRANDSFKYYGSVAPEFTYDVDGLGFGETLDIFSGNLEREQGEDEGDYDILIGSLTAQNYDIEYIKGTFTVLPEHFSIIYDANGGEGEIEEASGEFGDTIILSRGNGFIKTGNAIVGWALSSGGEVEYELGEDFVIDVEENTTLYAVWTIVSFNVNYNKNSSEATGSINMVTTQYQNVIALDDGSNLQREDYTLIGWNTKADNTGTFYNLSENFALPADNITFYAVWEINKCQVVYVLEDGQSIDTLNYDYYTKVTLHNGEDIEKQGYSIIGWSDRGNSLTVKYGFSQEIDAPNKSEFKIYPVWQLNTYLISYDIDGAEGQIDNQSVTYMDTIELSDGAGITKEGFTLTGWEFDNQTYDLQQSFQMPYSDVTVSAIWKRVIQYIVDDEVYDSGDYNDGDTAALIEFNQIREGYVFGGWSMLDGEQLSENEIIMDDNKTVYALWLPIDYNIEYVLNNGTLPEDYPDTYNIESELTLPIPKRDGYKFNGWYTNSEFAGEKVTSIPVGSIGDRKYYASFSKSELNAVDISLISISAVILVVGLVLLYLYLKKKKQKSN